MSENYKIKNDVHIDSISTYFQIIIYSQLDNKDNGCVTEDGGDDWQHGAVVAVYQYIHH